MPSCLAYNFANGTCSFLSDVTGVEYPAPGYIAAWKGYWAGGAPSALNSTVSTGYPSASGSDPFNTTSPTLNETTASALIATPTANSSTISSTLITATSGTPVPSSNSSYAVTGTLGSSTTSTPSLTTATAIPGNGSTLNSTFPVCSTTGDCLAVFEEQYCSDEAGQVYTVTCGIAFQGPLIGQAKRRRQSNLTLLDCEASCDSQALAWR